METSYEHISLHAPWDLQNSLVTSGCAIAEAGGAAAGGEGAAAGARRRLQPVPRLAACLRGQLRPRGGGVGGLYTKPSN
jgi:hypothetical protein